MGKYTDMIKSKNGINGNFIVEVAKALDANTSAIRQGRDSIIAKSYKGDHSPNQALYEAIVEESLTNRAVTDLDSTMAEVNRISPMVDALNVKTNKLEQDLISSEGTHDRLSQDVSEHDVQIAQMATAITQMYSHIQDLQSTNITDLHVAGDKVYVKTHDGRIIGNGVTIPNGGGGTPTVPVTGINVSPTSISVKPGDTRQISVTYVPTNTTELGVTYSSSNPSVVEVTNSGFVTAISNGSATITVRSSVNSSISKSIGVSVTALDVPVTAISPNSPSETLEIGQTFNLGWTYTPSNATNPSFNVTASNGNVQIDNLTPTAKRLTAVYPGETTITITETKSSVSTTMRVIVPNPPSTTLKIVKTTAVDFAANPPTTNAGGGNRGFMDTQVRIPAGKKVTRYLLPAYNTTSVGSTITSIEVGVVNPDTMEIIESWIATFTCEGKVEGTFPNRDMYSTPVNKTYNVPVCFLYRRKDAVKYNIGLKGGVTNNALKKPNFVGVSGDPYVPNLTPGAILKPTEQGGSFGPGDVMIPDSGYLYMAAEYED